MTWFVEEMTPRGTWTPVLYHGDRPTKRRADGATRRFRREPRKLPAHLRGEKLEHIAKLMAFPITVSKVPDHA